MLNRQEDMDMKNPEEHFLWALMGLPGPDATAMMLLPAPVLRTWSRHLYNCGFRHHPEHQTITYRTPLDTLTPGGGWTPTTQEDTSDIP